MFAPAAGRGTLRALCLLVGALSGFLEVWLSYTTGFLQVGDVVPIFLTGPAAWAVVGILLAVARLDRRRGLPEFLLAVAAVLLLALRGGPGTQPWGWALSLAALLAVGLVVRYRASFERAVAAALAAQALAALGLAVRMVPAGDPRPVSWPGIVAGAGAFWLAALALLAVRRLDLLARSALVFGLAAAASGVVAVRLSERPAARPALPVPPGGRGPGIVLVTLDTVRRDHLSTYGYSRATSPGLDAFARGAVLFENAYAPSPYTLSSHASLFTGLLPSAHGAHPVSAGNGEAREPGRLWDYPLRPDVPTLAEQLSQRGYRTGAVVANSAYLAEWTGLHRGFLDYDCEPQRIYRYVPLVLPVALRVAPGLFEHLSPTRKRSARLVTDAALRWLDRVKGAPFLLFVNYMDAHDPYVPPPPFDRRYAAEGQVPVSPDNMRGIVKGVRHPTPGQRAFLEAQYDGEIAYLDEQLTRLLSVLTSRASREPLIVAITSDHGEFFGEHGVAGLHQPLYGHGKALYEEVVSIPLLVRLPGGAGAGQRVSTRFGLHDLHDWLLRLSNGGPPDLPPSAGDAPRVLAEYWTRRTEPQRYHGEALRAIYGGPHKLIQTSSGDDELFDLESDPREATNLLPGAESAARLRDTLAEALPPLSVVPRGRPVIDRGALERLRALGYVQ